MKAKRTRLSPEQRRDQILDSAKNLILDKGLNAFTIDLLAEAAEISTPLVYKYYATRLELLQELLVREHAVFGDRFSERIKGTDGTQEILRVLVEMNFEEVSRSSIVFLLRQQPDVERVLVNREKQSSRQLRSFVLKQISKEFACSKKRAELIAAMASAASYAAAEYYDAWSGNRNQLIDRAVSFIWAGMEKDTQKTFH